MVSTPPLQKLASLQIVGATFLLAMLGFACLVLLSLSMALAWTPVPHEVRLVFDVASEANVWTWANVSVLSLAAYAYLYAAYVRWTSFIPGAIAWLLLGAVLLALSLDDLAGFHEKLGALGTAFGGGSGLTHFAWIIPGSVIALAVLGLCGVALLRIAGRPRRLLAIAAISFFAGAIGLEAVGGSIYAAQGYNTLYVTTYHVEELMEAAGATVFLCAGLADLPLANRSLGDLFARSA
ncbi:hypothetical protein [Mesorhizobium sp. CAU 1741]|uniref:hypothetical protein n=1 Tax=Mesorhizobium sp. CAU 1741 TaxID=3140366 RepID=UPI00325C33E6